MYGRDLYACDGVKPCLLLPDWCLQAALSEDPNETPYRVKCVLGLQVQVGAVELQGADGILLMQASMGGLDSKAVLYPQTQDIAFSVSTVRWLMGVYLCLGGPCCGGWENARQRKNKGREFEGLLLSAHCTWICGAGACWNVCTPVISLGLSHVCFARMLLPRSLVSRPAMAPSSAPA